MDFDSLHSEYACYWAPKPVGRDGKPTYDPAVEIKCRWEDSQIEFSMPKMKEGVWTSGSAVFTSHPVVKGGYVWYGRYSRLVNRFVPHENPDAQRIEIRDRTPSIDAEEVEYIAYI